MTAATENTANYEVAYGMPRRSFVQQALREVERVLTNRGRAYAGEVDEFKNFREQARTGEMTLRQTFRGMIGQKLTRESNLKQHSRLHESYDSVLDTAGYAVLWLGYVLQATEEGSYVNDNA